MSVFDDWIDERITVQLLGEAKPVAGRLIEHNGRGMVLGVRTEKTHDEGIFEGLKEQGEATIFLPWFRIRAIATPLKVDTVA